MSLMDRNERRYVDEDLARQGDAHHAARDAEHLKRETLNRDKARKAWAVTC